MKISKEIRIKAKKLFQEGKVKREIETNKRIHFTVQGEKGEYSVIFEKKNENYLCDCPYFSLKGKRCSHIEAVKLFLRKSKLR